MQSRSERVPWLTLVLVMIGAVCVLSSRSAEILQYERSIVESGAVWRLLTGQLVHWTPRMAAIDLLVVLICGAWLEARSRRMLAWTMLTAAGLVGLTVHLLTDLPTYRGSSGIASALYVGLAAVLVTGHSPRWLRLTALAALVGFSTKTAAELATGDTFFAGALPPGITTVPAVHLAGAAAGLLCVAIASRRDRRFHYPAVAISGPSSPGTSGTST